MGMSSGGGDKKNVSSDINVTPLIDVLLVLLIIFLVVMPIMMKKETLTVPRKIDDVNEQPDPNAHLYSVKLRADSTLIFPSLRPTAFLFSFARPNNSSGHASETANLPERECNGNGNHRTLRPCSCSGTAGENDGSHPPGAGGEPPLPVAMKLLMLPVKFAPHCGKSVMPEPASDPGNFTSAPAISVSGA